jgi:nitrite reductase/ring-hydroxylating ferredoxin subunit
MPESRENRVERIVSALLRGGRLKLRGGDAEEKEAIIAAARLAAARQGPQRMNPAFRQRLARELEAAPRDGWLTRRAALVAGFGALAGAVGGGLVARGLQGAPAVVTAGRAIRPPDGHWMDVGALADFPVGDARQVKAGSIGAFVYRTDSKVSAVSSICSDLPCELWWDGSHSVLACPCHNKTFTAQGRSTEEQYPLPPLDTVDVRITASGRVEVFGV